MKRWRKVLPFLACLLVLVQIQQFRLHSQASHDIQEVSLPIEEFVETPQPRQYVALQANSSTKAATVLQQHIANTTLPEAQRKWAYVFLIGGACHPEKEHRGFLYNVVISAQKLRDCGSKADIMVLVQISYMAPERRLPPDQEELLRTMNIRLKYLPRFAGRRHEKMYALMLEKFRILDLVEYSRILFLDSDVMPRCNLDYLFELSDPLPPSKPLLKENVILGWKLEPCNGGFFMVKPNATDYQLVLQTIRRREEEALAMPFPFWDPVKGWGHVIRPPDFWRSPLGTVGNNWTWYGSYADQGLLYYYTKYLKQSVSAIYRGDIENWGTGKNGTLQIEERHVRVLNQYTCRPPIKQDYIGTPSPYRDFVHFTGKKKPWHQSLEGVQSALRNASQETELDGSLEWYQILVKVANTTGLPIAMDFFGKTEATGVAPGLRQMRKHLVQKAKKSWNQYLDEEVPTTNW